jgi:GxxExxY protein
MKDRVFELTDVVRETGYAIHSYHGPGHMEKVYENALVHRLRKQGLNVEQQKPLTVRDEDGTVVGEYVADVVVEEQLILEVKAAKAIVDDHVAQTLGYLRSARLEHGAIVNFGAPKFQIRKLAMSETLHQPNPSGSSPLLTLLFSSFFVFFGYLSSSSLPTANAAPASGPLRVSRENPRYLADGNRRIVYLTGSHTWSSLQDQGATDPPPVFDYDRYLDFLETHHHNFIRLWAWEQARWAPWSDGKGPNPKDWFIQPNPYARTGPGAALDGKPKFDLSKFDPAYFDRLRERVKKAGDRGIYVSIMLFQGWSSAKGWLGGKPWMGHPYNPANNIQGFNGNKHSDTGPDLSDPQVREMQAAYIRKVIDTVNDLDNVLYEVTNEGGYKDWDWWVVDTVHQYEKTKAKQHPVGVTGHGSESNDEMLASPADWFSPGADPWPDLRKDPRAVDGKKVSLLDTDHVFGVGGDQKWVWKGFLRGHNVLYMDPYDDPEWKPVLQGQGVDMRWADVARPAMGHARRYAERMNLAKATPRPELASTGYCLANSGSEYLVYLPEGGKATVDLSAARGRFAVEWSHPITGQVTPAEPVEAGARREFAAPFEGDAVLYLSAKR